MRAVLMAAGIGSRISREISRPKSLLDVNGKPLIVNTVDMLARHRVQTAVVLGYQQDMYRDAIGGHEVQIYENPFFRVTNSMASLWFARDFIVPGEDLLLANADVFWDDEIFSYLVQETPGALMLGDRSRALLGDYFMELKNERIISHGKEMTPSKRTCEYLGLAHIKGHQTARFKEMLEEMVLNERYSQWWEYVLYDHLDELDVRVKDIDARFWAEIDYVEDYQRIRDHFE